VSNLSDNGSTTVSATFSGEIEELLRSLVGKLQSCPSQFGRNDTGPTHEQVLLDVEVDDVRLLAVRQRQPTPMSLLSPREQEIASMVARGYPNKTIASVLEISSWTVASHLRRIFMKLQVSSRAAMATRLTEIGPKRMSLERQRPGSARMARRAAHDGGDKRTGSYDAASRRRALRQSAGGKPAGQPNPGQRDHRESGQRKVGVAY
jgi:DNA-binding CsgD family transcriptional regulator